MKKTSERVRVMSKQEQNEKIKRAVIKKRESKEKTNRERRKEKRKKDNEGNV